MNKELGQPAEHDADHGDVQPSLGRLSGSLVVTHLRLSIESALETVHWEGPVG
jgi:hypothetical protein